MIAGLVSHSPPASPACIAACKLPPPLCLLWLPPPDACSYACLPYEHDSSRCCLVLTWCSPHANTDCHLHALCSSRCCLVLPWCSPHANTDFPLHAHGGGNRCLHEGCTKSAIGGTDYCKGHGGGKRCLHEASEGESSRSLLAPSSDRRGGVQGYCARGGGGNWNRRRGTAGKRRRRSAK